MLGSRVTWHLAKCEALDGNCSYYHNHHINSTFSKKKLPHLINPTKWLETINFPSSDVAGIMGWVQNEKSTLHLATRHVPWKCFLV